MILWIVVLVQEDTVVVTTGTAVPPEGLIVCVCVCFDFVRSWVVDIYLFIYKYIYIYLYIYIGKQLKKGDSFSFLILTSTWDDEFVCVFLGWMILSLLPDTIQFPGVPYTVSLSSKVYIKTSIRVPPCRRTQEKASPTT